MVTKVRRKRVKVPLLFAVERSDGEGKGGGIIRCTIYHRNKVHLYTGLRLCDETWIIIRVCGGKEKF